MNLFGKKKGIVVRENLPKQVKQYLSLLKGQTDSDTFVVFDTETTGLDVKKDRMLSIGGLRLNTETLVVADSFSTYVHQPSYKGEAASVHGISLEDLRDAPSESDAVLTWLEFVKTDVVIGHHVGFDHAMIEASLQRDYGIQFSNKRLDTLDLVRHADEAFSVKKSLPSKHLGLDYLCEHYHIPIEDRHTALGDAYMTGLLFLKVMSITPNLDLHRLIR